VTDIDGYLECQFNVALFLQELGHYVVMDLIIFSGVGATKTSTLLSEVKLGRSSLRDF
jgi:hypothetical protein